MPTTLATKTIQRKRCMARRIAELVACDSRTLWFCRSLDQRKKDPELLRAGYIEWLEAAVLQIIHPLSR